MQLRLSGTNVRPPPRQFGRNAERNTRRRRRHQPWPAEFGLQCSGRLVQQQTEGVDVLGFLLLQRRQLRANAFDLRRSILDIEAVLQAALLPFLHELKDVAANLQIVVRDPDLRLDAAQLDIVAREFREA
jgi:hypothetical protein